jgi:hypothetical protein
VIRAYLHDLERALSFDRTLARRVCEEAELHLLEAVAADPAVDNSEAERNAIAQFGDPKIIAAQFAAISLARQARRIASTVVLIVFGIFVAMKARVEWYAATQWTMPADKKSIADVILHIDRYAFWTSVFLGIAIYFYMSSRRVADRSAHDVRRTYRGCTMVTAALAISVVADALLTALQLHGTQLCSASIPPLLSLSAEIAGVSFLGLRVLWLMQRARSMASLLAG